MGENLPRIYSLQPWRFASSRKLQYPIVNDEEVSKIPNPSAKTSEALVSELFLKFRMWIYIESVRMKSACQHHSMHPASTSTLVCRLRLGLCILYILCICCFAALQLLVGEISDWLQKNYLIRFPLKISQASKPSCNKNEMSNSHVMKLLPSIRQAIQDRPHDLKDLMPSATTTNVEMVGCAPTKSAKKIPWF